MSKDPYVYDDTNVLKNLANIKEQHKFDYYLICKINVRNTRVTFAPYGTFRFSPQKMQLLSHHFNCLLKPNLNFIVKMV